LYLIQKQVNEIENNLLIFAIQLVIDKKMSKKLIIWSEAYSVDIIEIDNQHMKLIDMLNKLYNLYLDKNYNEIQGIIREIKDYTLYHFSTEERLFREKNYPQATEHISKHEEFIKELNQLCGNYLNNPSILTLKTMTFLQKWLTTHILKEDKKYMGYLK